MANGMCTVYIIWPMQLWMSSRNIDAKSSLNSTDFSIYWFVKKCDVKHVHLSAVFCLSVCAISKKRNIGLSGLIMINYTCN